MKNICMIAYTNYLEDQRVRREAETLASLPDYSVTVLSLKTGRLPRAYEVDNVSVLEMNGRKYCGTNKVKYLLSYIRFMLFTFLACTKLFISRKIEVIHVHNMPDLMVFAAIIPRVFKKKLILDIHDTMPETYTAKFDTSSSLLFNALSFEEFICCALAHKIICVNHAQRDVLLKRGVPSEKLHISLNVPDHNRFNSKKIKTVDKIEDGRFRMVYHGTIEKRLGIDLAIEAVARLVHDIANLEFHIWGRPWGDSNDFVRLTKELGVEERIHFISGGIPFEKLPMELRSMDIGIVGNRKNMATELMLPVKMLEYVALGIPTIVPRLEAIEYYFSDEMVCYFEPDDVGSMASAILKLYKNKSLRITQAKKAKAFLAQYGWEKHQTDLINFYREI